MFWRTIIINCGECGARLRKYYSGSLRVGPEFATCRKCGVVGRTGAFEWANLSQWRRIEVFFTEDVVVLLALLAYSVYVFVTTANGDDRFIAKSGIVATTGFVLLLWFGRVVEVLRSRRRTRENQ